MKSLRIEPKHFAIIVLFAAIAVLPMLFRGMPGGNDTVQHYEFAQHVVDSVKAGNAFPSFAGNANHGFGDVGLRVYPPLAYYALAGFYFVLGEWYAASIAAFFLIFLVSGVGIYLWANEYFSVNAALAAAAVYTFAPFHLNEIYNNFLYAEFAAGAILPFCFLFVTRTLSKGGLSNTILLGVAYALLILTHLPLTVIGSIAMAVYVLASLRGSNLKRIGNLLASVMTGLLLSSFYWVRMVTEMQWVKHSQSEFFSNIWSYQENFLISARTFTDFMSDGLSLWFGDLILIATLILCIPAIIAFIKSAEEKKIIAPLVVLLAAAIFFTTPLSTLLWDNFPLLQKVQFPWRWLTIVTLAASMIAGAGLVRIREHLRSTQSKFATILVASAVLPFVFLSAFVVRAPHFTSRTEFNSRGGSLSAGETFEGWWPGWAKRQAFSRKEKLKAGDRTFEIERWEPTTRSFTVGPGGAEDIEVATFYYPHWKASIDGAETEIRPTSDGLIAFKIPSNASRIELSFTEPAKVVASMWISAAAWISAILILVINFIRKRKSNGTYS